jgi:internalin A
MYVLLYRARMETAHPRLARSQRRRRFQRHSVAVGSGLNETATTAGSISWLARSILLFVLAIIVSIDAGEGAERSSRPEKTEQARVASIRGKTNLEGIDPAFVDAVRRIDEVRGQIAFDSRGKLVGLDLSSGRVSVTDADLALLTTLPRLRVLKLSGGQVTGAGMHHVAGLSELAELWLLDAQIGDAGLRQLTTLKRLRTLRVRRCMSLTDDVLASLSQFPELTHVALIESAFTDQGIGHLKNLSGLKALDLRGCSAVTDVGLAQLKGLTKLTALKLGGYSITDAGLAVVRHFPSLDSLTVEDAAVTDAGLASLKGLPLEELAFTRCLGVGDEGLRHVKDLRSLHVLWLRDTAVSGAGMIHLAGLSSLRSLTVSRCGMDDAGVERLARLSGLETLNLQSDPNVTDACVDRLGQFKGLKSLVIGQTGISDDGFARLRAALPQCKMVREP